MCIENIVKRGQRRSQGTSVGDVLGMMDIFEMTVEMRFLGELLAADGACELTLMKPILGDKVIIIPGRRV